MLEEAIQVKSQLHDALMSGQSLSNVKDSLVGENNTLGGADILSSASVLGVFGNMVRDQLLSMMGDKRYFATLIRDRMKGAEALVLLSNHTGHYPIVELGGVREGEVIPQSLVDSGIIQLFVSFSVPTIEYGSMQISRMSCGLSVSTPVIFSNLKMVGGVFSDSGYELKATQNALSHIVGHEARQILDQIVGTYCNAYRRSLEQVGIYNI